MGDRDRAAGGTARSDLPVFVYGTLRPGGRNHPLVATRVQRCEPARLVGAVLHAGPTYPWIADGDGVVVGDLLHIGDAARARVLADLDRLERHRPGAHDNEYERVVRRVEVAHGVRTAWTYVAGPAARLGPVVPSGDWFDRPAPRSAP